MPWQWLELKREGEVALLTLDHEPENRLSGPVVQELRGALAELGRDRGVKALVVTGGREKYFCNGLDLEWMMKQDGPALSEFLLEITRLLKDTALFPRPLIGAINGHTFGLGTIWAAGFDFRIMREDRGWVCLPEADINIPLLPGMLAICEHGLGQRALREMAWTAKRYSGPEAVEVGFAREAVPRDRLLPAALELASFMAKKTPAFNTTKLWWAREVARIIDQDDPAAIRNMPIGAKT